MMRLKKVPIKELCKFLELADLVAVESREFQNKKQCMYIGK